MAVDEKISQLPEALTIADDDYVPIVQASSGLNKKAKVSAIVPDPSFIENIVVKTQADSALEIDKINWVTLINDHTISVPTPDASNLGKIIIVNNRSSSYSLTITGLVVMPMVLSGYNSIIGVVCVTNGVDYGWEVFSRYNIGDFDLISQTITNGVTDKSPSEDAVFDALALKLDLSGGNANQDIDIGNFSLNAKHVKINGTGGAGHIGLKHQSANITASASESSIGADSVGDPVWKNDGGAIDKLELQSNKTSIVTGNEASTTKYLNVKGVYDWAVGLFAPKASPTFTGTVTTPDIVVSNATGSTPAFFDAVDKLITTTAQLWGTWVQTWASKATPVDADIIGFHDSASTFVGVKSTLLNLWTAYLLPKIQALNYGETAIEIWSTNANYTTVNTTAKRLVVLQTGTLTAPRTITLNDVTSAGQEVVIVAGGSVTASNYIRVAVGFKINVTLNNVDISTTYSQTLFTSVSTNSWTGGSVGLLRQDATWGQLAGSGGTAGSNGNIFSVLNSSASTILLGLKDDGTQVQMNSTKHSFGTLTPGQIIFDRNLTFSNLITVTATNTTSTNYIQGWLNVGQSIYGFRYSNTLVALWQSNDNTASTILQKWSNASNVQIGVLQNDGLYFGTGTKSASAIFHLDSASLGSIPYPRMTNAQRTALTVGPTTYGLMVYCTDATEGLWIYKSTGWTFII